MKILTTLLSALLLISANVSANVIEVELYVDSGPNIFGSPDWNDWIDTSYSDIVNGTFTNMRSSTNSGNAGSYNFEIQDGVVYSFDDLGRRVHYIYWLPDQTIASLTNNFEVSLLAEWDGVWYDIYNSTLPGTQTWLEPTTWIEYAGGVIGTSGMAWWGAYDYNGASDPLEAQAALQADYAAFEGTMGDFQFCARTGTGSQESCILSTINAADVPEPASIAMFGLGLIGLWRLRKQA